MLSKLILAEYIYFGPILICLISNWTFFIRNNFLSAKIKAAKTDKLQKVNIVKKINIRVFFRWGIILNILVLIFLHTTRGHEGPVLYNHFYVSNFNFSVISFLIIVSTLLLYVAKNTDPRNSNLNVDYAFSVSSINIFIQTLFLVNSIYTLVFFLEITSVLIFYKFVSSRFWFKQKTKAGEKNSKFDFVLPKSYVNVMFFQY